MRKISQFVLLIPEDATVMPQNEILYMIKEPAFSQVFLSVRTAVVHPAGNR